MENTESTDKPNETLLDKLSHPKAGYWVIAIVAVVLIALWALKGARKESSDQAQWSNPKEGQAVISAGKKFQFVLPAGWENLTAESNMGLEIKNRREIVIRQRDAATTRLLMISLLREVDNKDSSVKKNLESLGWWRAKYKNLLELSSASAGLNPPAQGSPLMVFRLLSGEKSPGNAMTGMFIFKGELYEFFYMTTRPGDSELLTSIIHSLEPVSPPASVAGGGEKKHAAAEKKAAKKKPAK